MCVEYQLSFCIFINVGIICCFLMDFHRLFTLSGRLHEIMIRDEGMFCQPVSKYFATDSFIFKNTLFQKLQMYVLVCMWHLDALGRFETHTSLWPFMQMCVVSCAMDQVSRKETVPHYTRVPQARITFYLHFVVVCVEI